MITRPFNFEAHVTRPSTALDAVPYVNVGVLLLFFALLGSPFVLAPGVAFKLDLPTTPGVPPDVLPTSRVLTVSGVEGREMLIFEGRILNLISFERFMAERPALYAGEALLVRMDRDVSVALLARVLELAKRGGFNDVLLAAEPAQPVPPLSAGGGE